MPFNDWTEDISVDPSAALAKFFGVFGDSVIEEARNAPEDAAELAGRVYKIAKGVSEMPTTKAVIFLFPQAKADQFLDRMSATVDIVEMINGKPNGAISTAVGTAVSLRNAPAEHFGKAWNARVGTATSEATNAILDLRNEDK
ncbi:hypothetical protein [Thiomicrorhabdus sp.]|uniref:hypothetical protein n=1 Tax=Thiomicrorhabdus sp. TaxID=2039724 RepID=UPI0029C7536C|nr:hypothetical protein [Thiomicrorhabdus sp.]